MENQDHERLLIEAVELLRQVVRALDMMGVVEDFGDSPGIPSIPAILLHRINEFLDS